MAHCTKIEKAKRINHLLKMLSQGAVTSDLMQFCSTEWGLGERMSYKYVQAAREAIMEDVNLDRKEVVAELMHGARTVWKAAAKEKQFNNVLGAMNLIARLGGLEPK